VQRVDAEVGQSYQEPALSRLTIQQAKFFLKNHARELLELILPGRRQEPTETAVAKTYQKPALTKLTPEQAKLILIGHATMGDQGAKDLMEIFPHPF
jgi:hypothetical protein